MVQLNRRWAPHWSEDNPPCMTSPPLTLPLYTLSWYSLIAVRSQPTLYDYPPLTLPLYLLCTPPFYIPSLHTTPYD